MVHAPNLIVSCSKSGKLSTSHVTYFLEKCVKPNATGNILYLLDHWSGQTDKNIYKPFQNEDFNLNVMLIPEQTTDRLQPLDTYFNRQLKLLHRNTFSHCKIFNPEDYVHMTTRDGNLIVQFLNHFILKSPKFSGMIQHSWFKAGLRENDVEFLGVNDLCFNFGNKNCDTPGCSNVGFIKCPWCSNVLCHIEYYRDYHTMKCLQSPYLS